MKFNRVKFTGEIDMKAIVKEWGSNIVLKEFAKEPAAKTWISANNMLTHRVVKKLDAKIYYVFK